MALGFLSRLKSGLARSTQKLTTGITETFTKRKLDDAALEELEELLIGADLGPAVAARIIKSFRRTRFGQDVSPSEIRTSLAAEIAEILAPVAKPLIIDPDRKPFVILMVGVNGTGNQTCTGHSKGMS
jgi:fused signal recognition particle receptor